MMVIVFRLLEKYRVREVGRESMFNIWPFSRHKLSPSDTDKYHGTPLPRLKEGGGRERN